MPNQCLADVGMQLRFKYRAVRILAGKNPFFEYALFQQLLQQSCNILEMMPDFVFDAALRVAAIVTAETIASSSPRKRVE